MALRLVPLAVSTFGEIAALGPEVPRLVPALQAGTTPAAQLAGTVSRIFAGARFRCTRTLWDGAMCNGGGYPTGQRRCSQPIRTPAWQTSTATVACRRGARCKSTPSASLGGLGLDTFSPAGSA